jgi:hypothetical protein
MGTQSGGDALRDAIERELAIVRGAITMVACGSSPGLTVGNLRFSEAVCQVVEPEARAAGVRLDRRWRLDESGCDLHVVPAEADDER